MRVFTRRYTPLATTVMNMENWLNNISQISSALLTPLLAIIGTIILIKQHSLQNLRWKLDLYDKRYPVFLNTMEYISYVVQHHNVTNEILFGFLRNSKDKEFLFQDDVKTFLESLYLKGLDLQVLKTQLKTEPKGEKRDHIVKQTSQIFHWFTEQFDVSKRLFGSYLGIGKK